MSKRILHGLGNYLKNTCGELPALGCITKKGILFLMFHPEFCKSSQVLYEGSQVQVFTSSQGFTKLDKYCKGAW